MTAEEKLVDKIMNEYKLEFTFIPQSQLEEKLCKLKERENQYNQDFFRAFVNFFDYVERKYKLLTKKTNSILEISDCKIKNKQQKEIFPIKLDHGLTVRFFTHQSATRFKLEVYSDLLKKNICEICKYSHLPHEFSNISLDFVPEYIYMFKAVQEYFITVMKEQIEVLENKLHQTVTFLRFDIIEDRINNE
jgi:hypothetical protein